MTGYRTRNNCYSQDSKSFDHSPMHSAATEKEEVKLWSQKLISKEVVKRTKLQIEKGRVCGSVDQNCVIRTKLQIDKGRVCGRVYQSCVIRTRLKSDEGIFVGYSTNSRDKVMIKSINVIDDNFTNAVETCFDTSTKTTDKYNDPNPTPSKSDFDTSNKIQKDHPKELIIGDSNSGVSNRSREIISNLCFVSKIEPKNVKEALNGQYWINAMREELGQFKRNEMWELVPRPKWIYKNKSNEYEFVTRNKTRLNAQGYTQKEGTGIDETFSPVAGLESIRLLLDVVCMLKLKLIQMDDAVVGGMQSEFAMCFVGELINLLGFQFKQMDV